MLEPRERLYLDESCRIVFWESTQFEGRSFTTVPIHRMSSYNPALGGNFPTDAGTGTGMAYFNLGEGDELPDNSLSSVQFNGNCFGTTLILYQDFDLQGRAEMLFADDNDLIDNSTRDNSASSYLILRR